MSAEPAVRDFEQVKQQRQTWEDLWQDIAELVLPRRDFTVKRTQGDTRHNRVFDSTAINANAQLAAGMESFLINPRTKWFELRTGDAELDENQDVQIWLQDVRDKLLNHFASRDSNFYPAVHEGFQDVAAFGTMVHFIGEDKSGKPRFTARPLSEIFVREDDDGRVDTVYRKYTLDTKQVAQMFPDAIPEEVTKAIEKNDLSREFEFLHAVHPRDMFDPNKPQTSGNMPFASAHFMLSGKSKGQKVRESGFRDFPFTVARWSKVPGEVYGRSPSMQVLPDIRMLQKMSETVLKAAQKVVDPPLLVPDDGFLHPVRTMPGGLNYYRSETGAGTANPSGLVPLQTGGQIQLGEQMIQIRQQSVQEAYMIRELLGLIDRGSSSPLKATEVVGRQQQALRQFAPILSRMQDEFLIPAVDRSFEMMLRNRELPEAPGVLQGRNIEVRFVSQAATAQQASENDNLLNWLQQVLPILEVDANAAMNIDTDAFVRKAAEANNVPADVLVSREAVQQQRQQAAQQQQQQQLLEQLQQAGGAAGTLSDAANTISEVQQRGRG
mgnify:FL=1